MSSYAHIRKTLLIKALMTLTFAQLSIGQPFGQPMTNHNTDNLRQLSHTLSRAYENALSHNTPNADLEAQDLLLETASIRFSSLILDELAKDSCQPPDHSAPEPMPSRTCILDDKAIGLRSLTDILSYAASRLENLGSSPSADDATGGHARVLARIGSLEHLYRMVFALSKIYFDRSQSAAYLQAAHNQLALARQCIETERSLCACDSPDYAARLQEFSNVENQLNDIR